MLYGLTESDVRDLREMKRRVLTGGFGRVKRQRWPVPTPQNLPNVIRFRFDSFESGSSTVASCTILGSANGFDVGTVVDVVDATTEGCFFTDETEAELVDRNGYAIYMRSAARYEVFSLCCPAEVT